MNTVVSVATVCLLVVCILTCTQVKAQQFRIVQTRVDGVNLVRLECRSNSAFDNALFYLNRTIIVHSSPLENVESHTHSFVVDRFTNEGMYSCGQSSGPDSDETPVIAYPKDDFQVQFDGVVTIRAKSGSTAILPSYIRSGIWHSRYYIDWEKQGGETVGRIDGLRSPMLVNMVPEGFSVDPANFSLMIESVSRSDSGTYYGRLGVTEGPSSITRSFEQTETMPIVLEVYEEPRVRQEREEVVVKKEENTNVEFKCFATGYPIPTIHWDHNFTLSQFNVLSTNINNTVVSTLTLYNAHSQDSGTVGCYAIVEPGGNTALLHSKIAVAKLSVLHIFEVSVYKTTKRELLFTIDLGEQVTIPTGLRIRLMDEGGISLVNTGDVYQRRNPITYVYDEPPNEVFTSVINVLIESSNGRVASTPFPVDISLEIDQTCSFHRQLVTVVVPSGAGLFVIALFFIVVFCLIHHRELNRRCKNFYEAHESQSVSREDRLAELGQLISFLQNCTGKSVQESATRESIDRSSRSNGGTSRLSSDPSQPNQTTDTEAGIGFNDTGCQLTHASLTNPTSISQSGSPAFSDEIKGRKTKGEPEKTSWKWTFKRKECTKEKAIQMAEFFFR